jgi:hypothetical protein
MQQNTMQNCCKLDGFIQKYLELQPLNPPRASRVYAYASIALYESVVDGIKNNKSLQGQLNGFGFNSIQQNT